MLEFMLMRRSPPGYRPLAVILKPPPSHALLSVTCYIDLPLGGPDFVKLRLRKMAYVPGFFRWKVFVYL